MLANGMTEARRGAAAGRVLLLVGEIMNGPFSCLWTTERGAFSRQPMRQEMLGKTVTIFPPFSQSPFSHHFPTRRHSVTLF
jgi:hypothetical protein